MGRRPNPSLSLSATVRQWFGLTQAEMARALGVSGALVEKVEAGLRTLPRAADERLEALALLGPGLADRPAPGPLALVSALAPAAEYPPPAPPGPLTATERLTIERRLARLEREAFKLRVAAAEQHPRRALLVARWAAALPALQAAANAAPPDAPLHPTRWLAAQAAHRAAPALPHTPGSQLAVAREALRLHLLTREIGYLRAWLAG